MTLFCNLFKKVLSHKLTGISFLIISICLKVFFQLLLFSIEGDKGFQIIAAKNLLYGNGLTIDYVSLENLSIENFTPLIAWPPGYSILLAPIIWLVGYDYILAAIILDILTVLFFYNILLKILHYLDLQKWLIHLFVLFAGLFNYPANSSTCSDLLSLTFLLYGVYYFLRLVNSASPMKLIAYCSICFFMAGFIRYNYIPITLLCPAFLIYLGLRNKQNDWKKTGIKIQIILLLLFGAFFLFQLTNTGHAAYINSSETGLYPENLRKIYPFIPASFIDLQNYLSVLSAYTPANYLFLYAVVAITTGILFVIISGWGIYIIIKKLSSPYDKTVHFTLTGTWVSITIIFLLVCLSLSNTPNILSSNNKWSYVQEFRYFVFVVVFIQLLVFAKLFNRYSQLNIFWKSISFVCAFLFFAGSVHKIYLFSKLVSNRSFSVLLLKNFKSESRPLFNALSQAQKEFPGSEIIVSASNYNFCNYASLKNVRVIRNTELLQNIQKIKDSRDIKILVCTDKEKDTAYSRFADDKSYCLLSKTNSINFYIVDAGQYK